MLCGYSASPGEEEHKTVRTTETHGLETTTHISKIRG